MVCQFLLNLNIISMRELQLRRQTAGEVNQMFGKKRKLGSFSRASPQQYKKVNSWKGRRLLKQFQGRCSRPVQRLARSAELCTAVLVSHYQCWNGLFGDEFALELSLFFVKYLLPHIPISNHNNNLIYLRSWTFVQLLLCRRKGGGGSRRRGEEREEEQERKSYRISINDLKTSQQGPFPNGFTTSS